MRTNAKHCETNVDIFAPRSTPLSRPAESYLRQGQQLQSTNEDTIAPGQVRSHPLQHGQQLRSAQHGEPCLCGIIVKLCARLHTTQILSEGQLIILGRRRMKAMRNRFAVQEDRRSMSIEPNLLLALMYHFIFRLQRHSTVPPAGYEVR